MTPSDRAVLEDRQRESSGRSTIARLGWALAADDNVEHTDAASDAADAADAYAAADAADAASAAAYDADDAYDTDAAETDAGTITHAVLASLDLLRDPL